jgi:hypothetical protein
MLRAREGERNQIKTVLILANITRNIQVDVFFCGNCESFVEAVIKLW